MESPPRDRDGSIMRVLFQWRADEPLELPTSYHHILQGIIYRNMNPDTGYSRFVHDHGYSYKKRRYRMFSFSQIRGRYRIEEKKIWFSGPLSFEVTSPDVYMIRSLADGMKRNGLSFGKTHFQNVNVSISDITVECDELMVQALSPITVYSTGEDRYTRYYSPFDDEFSDAVNDNFQRKYRAYYGLPPDCDICIRPVDVKENDKCVTRYKDFYITGYQGIYYLYGSRKGLDFLLQAGVGGKNAQGFGMVEPVDFVIEGEDT